MDLEIYSGFRELWNEGIVQGGDSPADTQALPVGKMIMAKVCRKDNPKVSQICIY